MRLAYDCAIHYIQDEFLEHNSGIVHARFSSEGNLIASCDMDNIVR